MGGAAGGGGVASAASAASASPPDRCGSGSDTSVARPPPCPAPAVATSSTPIRPRRRSTSCAPDAPKATRTSSRRRSSARSGTATASALRSGMASCSTCGDSCRASSMGTERYAGRASQTRTSAGGSPTMSARRCASASTLPRLVSSAPTESMAHSLTSPGWCTTGSRATRRRTARRSSKRGRPSFPPASDGSTSDAKRATCSVGRSASIGARRRGEGVVCVCVCAAQVRADVWAQGGGGGGDEARPTL